MDKNSWFFWSHSSTLSDLSFRFQSGAARSCPEQRPVASIVSFHKQHNAMGLYIERLNDKHAVFMLKRLCVRRFSFQAMLLAYAIVLCAELEMHAQEDGWFAFAPKPEIFSKDSPLDLRFLNEILHRDTYVLAQARF